MAQNELQGGAGVNLVLSKRFKIGEAPAPFMASEIFPTFVVENDRPEFHFLGGSRLWGISGTDLAVAAQFSAVGVQNPLNSGLISVVKEVWVTSGGLPAATFDLRIESATVGVTPDTVFQTVFLDTRNGPSVTRVPTTEGLLFTTGGAQPGIGFFRGTTDASGQFRRIVVDVVLGPGGRMWVTQAGVQIACVASFRGYERVAEPGELQGAES